MPAEVVALDETCREEAREILDRGRGGGRRRRLTAEERGDVVDEVHDVLSKAPGSRERSTSHAWELDMIEP